jgi:hypothetical protein
MSYDVVKGHILRKCALEGKENGMSKSALFENQKNSLSAVQMESVLQDLVDEGELLKVRRDRYIINEMVRQRAMDANVGSPLAFHVTQYKANHIIVLKDI